MKTLDENEISFLIRKCIFKIYNKIGPGLLESAYVMALCYELQKEQLEIKTQVEVPVIYDSAKLDIGYRIDILVNDLVIIEVKSVEAIMDRHKMQLLTYLRFSGKKLGILVNFYTDDISKSIIRRVNQL